MRRAVIIVAAGSGIRMGGEVPKQFMRLSGKPLIVHTLERFQTFDPEIKIVVVISAGQRKRWDRITASYKIPGEITLAEGGETRYDSVKKGLLHIENGIIAGIHDAVRPFVSQATLKRCYESAALNGSGIPVIEMDESVRMLDPQGGSTPLERSRLRRVQTPQVFLSGRIKEAYQLPYDPAYTDDASVYEALFGKVTLVEGNRENIKITTPTDMKLASLIIGSVG